MNPKMDLSEVEESLERLLHSAGNGRTIATHGLYTPSSLLVRGIMHHHV
jgi:hypothetical protein